MLIELYSDFACPFCYIGKTNLEQAIKDFAHKEDIKVVFKSYQLNPNAPFTTDKNSYESFSESHGVRIEDVKARFTSITEHAKNSGLTFNFEIMKMTNTRLAHRLYKYADEHGKGSEIMAALLDGYFTQGLNLADENTLIEIGLRFDLAKDDLKEALLSKKYDEMVQSDIDEAQSLGISSVPFFVVNQKYAISGGQPKEYFLEALTQIYNESKVEEGNDLSCGPEGCSI